MHFLSLVRLPFSLLVISLALAASALPTVQSTELLVLTPDNFKETTSKGVWLIEHFSPYCSHCRHFKPTWEKLVEECEKKEDPGIRLAQVNCIMHGDLCNQNKVTGYPQLNLYRDGEFVEQYTKSRDFDLLMAFINKHAEPTGGPAPAITSNSATAAGITSTPVAPSTPKIDFNPRGEVEVLTDKTFSAALARGPAFVKFYAPWCGHCKKLAPHWAQLAAHEKNKLTIAEVNCEEEGALCKREGVNGYPALFYYSASGQKTEYTGGRKFEALSAFADKAASPAVQELPEGKLNEKLKEDEVVFVFLQSVAEPKILNTLTLASQSLLGTAPVYTIISPALFERFRISPSSGPFLLALKDRDGTVAAKLPVDANMSTAKLQSWLMSEKLPTSLELSADTFKSVMEAPGSPLVVLVAVPAPGAARDDAVGQLRETAKQWRGTRTGQYQRGVVFAWMDGDRWSSWLNSMYGIKSSNLPAVVITDHGRLVYWENDEHGSLIQLSPTSIFSALEGALKGTVSYKNSENIIERMARYLNDKLTWLEEAVINNPIRTGIVFVGSLAVIFWAIKRSLADEVVFVEHPTSHSNGNTHSKSRKSRRAD